MLTHHRSLSDSTTSSTQVMIDKDGREFGGMPRADQFHQLATYFTPAYKASPVEIKALLSAFFQIGVKDGIGKVYNYNIYLLDASLQTMTIDFHGQKKAPQSAEEFYLLAEAIIRLEKYQDVEFDIYDSSGAIASQHYRYLFAVNLLLEAAVLKHELAIKEINSFHAGDYNVQSVSQFASLYFYKYESENKLVLNLAGATLTALETAAEFYDLAKKMKAHIGQKELPRMILKIENNIVNYIDSKQLKSFYYNLLNDAAKEHHFQAEADLNEAIIAQIPEALVHLNLKKAVLFTFSGNAVKVMLPCKMETKEQIQKLGNDLLLASKMMGVNDECKGVYFKISGVKREVIYQLANELIEQARKMAVKATQETIQMKRGSSGLNMNNLRISSPSPTNASPDGRFTPPPANIIIDTSFLTNSTTDTFFNKKSPEPVASQDVRHDRNRFTY